MICKTALLFLAVSSSGINAARLGTFAPRRLSSDRLAVFVPRNLDARIVNTSGGWSLSQTSAAICPATAPQCGATWCCPESLQCIHTGGEDSAEVCCPTDSDCSATFLAAPACADASWSLWNATSDTSDNGGFFCCLQHQVGLQSGSCADDLEVVTAATPVAVQLATGSGSVQGEVAATTTAVSTTAVSATGSTSSTTGKGVSSGTSPATKSSSASTTSATKSSSVASSSTPASSSTSAGTGKSGAESSYHTGRMSLGVLAAAFAFALL